MMMTLNITVATPRSIYQCADYRLLDWTTGTLTDFDTQKIVLAGNPRWTATVCFAGVGRTHQVDVGTWLAKRVAAIGSEDPLDRLLEELQTADEWLKDVPAPHNRHSFSVGAFDRGQPVFALISNFETINAPTLSEACGHLSVSIMKPVIAVAFVSGVQEALNRADRRQLSRLATRTSAPQRMHHAMASANRTASERSRFVSPACFTTHVRVTGEAGGIAHEIGSRPFMPEFAFPPEHREALTRLLDEHFGRGRARLRQIAVVHSEPTEEYHQIQLREKPNDPNTHSNYGAFLKDKNGDVAGAERAYNKALELDPDHVNALGNLANLRWEQGDTASAAALYRKAFDGEPKNENVTCNYAHFLNDVKGDGAGSAAVLRAGICDNPKSGRLHLELGEVILRHSRYSEALDSLRCARENGADQARVACALACALHCLGAELGECLAAYWNAVTLNPQNAVVRLNLAQLLFLKRDDREAKKQLQKALQIGLEDAALLEARFYELAHTAPEPAPALQDLKECLGGGVRLQWNVLPNIERVRTEDPDKAELLEIVREVMIGEREPASLAEVASRWPSGHAARDLES